ncbi:bleomycin resistance protein [Streptomyces sp. IMTB 2501]|uniref:VOC family protein n=1 Tax=Streptomyces sp. IMTB 2501 TaxID=1776340 RepID=UPI00096CFB82|nr:VOC family protein [Streptomyces sp. IMTB 2501]OLZ73690.1 bleomycin resistance protein [Streptomyces sp. IMTB 2501]
MNHGTTHSSSATDVVLTRSVFGAPCWVSLTSRDLDATQGFYGAVLGWRCRRARLGDHFRTALADGVPVAGIAGVAAMWQMAVAWTPYFAVTDADEAVARAQERCGTLAVGPISFPPGRAALLADRHGATFGIWQGKLVTEWETWRQVAPTFITLHTRDAFDAAFFYGEILDWASGLPGACEVEYAGGEVLLRSQGDIVARIESGSVETPPDPSVRPHWQVHFAVADVGPCARAAEKHGGSVLEEGEQEAVLRDPDGAQFTVTSRRLR